MALPGVSNRHLAYSDVRYLPADRNRDQFLCCYLPRSQLFEKGRNIGMFWDDALIHGGELSLAALDGTITILPFLLHGGLPIHAAQ